MSTNRVHFLEDSCVGSFSSYSWLLQGVGAITDQHPNRSIFMDLNRKSFWKSHEALRRHMGYLASCQQSSTQSTVRWCSHPSTPPFYCTQIYVELLPLLCDFHGPEEEEKDWKCNWRHTWMKIIKDRRASQICTFIARLCNLCVKLGTVV